MQIYPIFSALIDLDDGQFIYDRNMSGLVDDKLEMNLED